MEILSLCQQLGMLLNLKYPYEKRAKYDAPLHSPGSLMMCYGDGNSVVMLRQNMRQKHWTAHLTQGAETANPTNSQRDRNGHPMASRDTLSTYT